MSKIDIREIKSHEYHTWDKLVMNSPQGTVFHLSDWIDTCASLSHKKPFFIGYYEDNELIGGCSLYIYSKFRAIHFANSIASMTPYGGYILSDSDSTKVREKEIRNQLIISGISDEIAKMNFVYMQITNPPAFRDIRPFTWNSWTCHVNYTYILPLVEDLFSFISKNVRRTIRKGEKNNIQICKCYDPELFWDLNVSTYDKQKMKPPIKKEFFMGMLNMIIKNNLGEMWIAKTPEGEAASAEIITWDTHMAHRWSAASNYKHKDTGATSLLLFEIFQDLHRRGFNFINLMAGNTPHLSMFISSFNAELIPYYMVEKKRFWLDFVAFFRRAMSNDI